MNRTALKQAGRLAGIALAGFFILSCKKDHPQPEPEPEPEPSNRTEAQQIKDDIYTYYKLYSVWADESIPDHLKDPAAYTDQYSSPNAVLSALKALTPVHQAAGYSGVFDRFSYMDGINGYDINGRAGLKMDNNDGYGISVQWFSTDGKTAKPYLSFVEGGSPGQQAGFRRSDIITAINNDQEQYVVQVNCPDQSCTIVQEDQSKFQKLQQTINGALDAANFTLQVKRSDGSTFTKPIDSRSYTINPIYKDTVYSYSGNRQVGYLALSSFEEIENNNSNQQNLDAVFTKFQQQQISYLVVDLRYNGGGYVDAAIYTADKIGGAKTKGKLMLSYEMNNYMQSGAAKSLRDQLHMYDTYFKGLSTLNLSKVYFLVSEETASAAEMLVNVLTPQLPVQLIATGSRTYGKPVGFFEQKVKNKVSYWPASFILKNSRGNVGEKYNKGTTRDLRDYWDGLVPDLIKQGDDVSLPVGDSNERILAAALADAVPSSTSRAALRKRSSTTFGLVEQGKLHSRPERGMIKTFKK